MRARSYLLRLQTASLSCSNIRGFADREEKIVTDILSGFRDLVIHGSEQVNNAASAGQAAFNSMTLDVTMNGLVRALLGLPFFVLLLFAQTPNWMLTSPARSSQPKISSS